MASGQTIIGRHGPSARKQGVGAVSPTDVSAIGPLAHWSHGVGLQRSCASPERQPRRWACRRPRLDQNLTQPDTGFPCCNGSTRVQCRGRSGRPTRAFLDEDGLWYALLDSDSGAADPAARGTGSSLHLMATRTSAPKGQMRAHLLLPGWQPGRSDTTSGSPIHGLTALRHRMARSIAPTRAGVIGPQRMTRRKCRNKAGSR